MKKLIFILLMLCPLLLYGQKTLRIADREGYVFAYVVTPAATTTTDAGTYYYLESAFTNAYDRSFGFVSDTLQYQGVSGLGVIMVTGSFTTDTNNTEITMAVKVNGELVTHSEMTVEINATTDVSPLAILNISWINNGDNISLWLKSDKAGAVITPVTLTTGIMML